MWQLMHTAGGFPPLRTLDKQLGLKDFDMSQVPRLTHKIRGARARYPPFLPPGRVGAIQAARMFWKPRHYVRSAGGTFSSTKSSLEGI